MDTKDLSPAFLTSLAGIFVGAILIGLSSTVATIFGWILLLAALALNVFSSMVSIQRYKGGFLPSFIHEDTVEHTEQADLDQDNEMTVMIQTLEEPAADTEAHRVITVEGDQTDGGSEEKIFRARPPRPRNR